ncbi:hypothetical protein BZL41_09545 [Pseudomonas sp. PIC25]|nr:hypothetical protein BZL41_09545 [Pseudomonas sp. PIC25]
MQQHYLVGVALLVGSIEQACLVLPTQMPEQWVEKNDFAGFRGLYHVAAWSDGSVLSLRARGEVLHSPDGVPHQTLFNVRCASALLRFVAAEALHGFSSRDLEQASQTQPQNCNHHP